MARRAARAAAQRSQSREVLSKVGTGQLSMLRLSITAPGGLPRDHRSHLCHFTDEKTETQMGGHQPVRQSQAQPRSPNSQPSALFTQFLISLLWVLVSPPTPWEC